MKIHVSSDFETVIVKDLGVFFFLRSKEFNNDDDISWKNPVVLFSTYGKCIDSLKIGKTKNACYPSSHCMGSYYTE